MGGSQGHTSGVHFPWSPVSASCQPGSFVVAENFLFSGVPADLPPGEHRDHTKMARNRGMMPNLYRSDGSLTRPDAIQEVLMVILRGVQFHPAQLSRKIFAPLKSGVRDVKSIAVDPNPAVSADQFGTHLDVWIVARDRQEHTTQKKENETILLGGVPIRIGRRKIAAAFHLH